MLPVPFCLRGIKDTAYVDFCLHRFSFACNREWAGGRARCPHCRERFNLLLHLVQVDDHYEEYVVPSSSRHCKEHFPTLSQQHQKAKGRISWGV